MALFSIAYKITKGNEGIYSNDANDLGGETVYGIARKYNADWKGWPIVDKIRGQQINMSVLIQKEPLLLTYAQEFYKADYWDTLRLDLVNNQKIANKLFDMAVNIGVGRVKVWLQEVLNVLNDRGRIYPDIKVDGSIGKVTIETLNKNPKPENIINALTALQGAHYIQRAKDNPSQERFLNGWLIRAFSV